MSARARAHTCCRLWLLLWACTLSHAHARAQQPTLEPGQTGAGRAYVHVSDCGAPPWTHDQASELLRALALELQSDGVEQVQATDDDDERTTPLLWLDVDCATTAQFELRARSAPAVEPSSRRMDLRDVPEALRPRALALALAELLRTSRRPTSPATPATAAAQVDTDPSNASEGTGKDERVAQPSEAASAPVAASASASPTLQAPSRRPRQDAADEQPDPQPRHMLSIAPNARWLPASSDVLYGAAIGWQWLRFGAGINALFSQASDTLGATHFGLVHAVLSYQLLRLRLGRQILHAGPELGAGVTWASAASNASANGGSAMLLSYEAGVRLGVTRDFSSGLAGGLYLEGGYAHGPRLRADDRDLATLSGAFLGLGLRVSFGF